MCFQYDLLFSLLAKNTVTQWKQNWALKHSLVIYQGMLEVLEPLGVTMISDTEQNSNKMSHKWDTCERVEVTQRLGAQGT